MQNAHLTAPDSLPRAAHTGERRPHGGNIRGAARQYGLSEKDIIDFSSNVNPLGPPPAALKEITRSFSHLGRYPDPDAADLRMAIAGHYGIQPDEIVCGNGSNGLIHLIPRTFRPKKVLIPVPTFTEYAAAVEAAKAAAAAPATTTAQPAATTASTGAAAATGTQTAATTASLPDLLKAADPATGEKVAAKCKACHDFAKGGPNKVGPNLWDIVGAKQAHLDNFNYSDAVKGLGGQWTYENLDKFVTAPKEYAPGTKMAFPGLKKPEDRAAVIAYLRTLSDSPKPLP